MKTLASLLIVFAACATANAAILLRDNFTYADGALTNVSAGKWRHSSGGADEVNVTNEVVELTRSETEDVDSALAVSYSAGSGATLYAKFSLLALSLPAGANGNYFAHFAGASARARVFAVTNGAAAGKFRLGIANGATASSAIWPVDLNTNQNYTVITRLSISNAQSMLWIDPASDSDASISASDTASASSANAFALRQDSGMGVLVLDNLVVATSFGEALSDNETPSISNIPDQQIPEGGSTAAIPFTMGDAETPAGALSLLVRASPSNTVLVSFGGSDSNRTVTVSAFSTLTNTTTVTVLVTDGTTTNSDSFVVTFVPALLFSDEFNYADGALITNGTPPWEHHSGTVTGQVQVTSGRITLSTAFTEDVSVSLPKGPFTTNSGVTLYASLLVSFSQLPGPTGDYFAHFNTSGARGRIFASRANAGAGKFRLGVANAANSASEQLAVDLSTDTDYRVVLRYDPATATSRLWVNPGTELDDGTNATDTATATPISAFAFRQDAGIGVLTIDDLRLGLTFAAVTAPLAPALRIERLSNDVRLSWPVSAAGFVLQTNSLVHSTNWENVIQTPSVVGSENVLTNPVSPGHLFFRLKK